MNRHNPVLAGMAGSTLFMLWSRSDQIRFSAVRTWRVNQAKAGFLWFFLGPAQPRKNRRPRRTWKECKRLNFAFSSLFEKQIHKAVAAAPPSFKSPPGGVLSFSKAEKKERKKLLLF